MDSFSSSNVLSLEERARLVRSARKLEQVLGSKAFLLKSSNARHLLPSVRPRATHARALTETDMYAAQIDAGRTPPRRRIESTTRRQASIFDLTEEQLLALGIKHHPGTLRNLSIEDVPRPSTDSAPSSAYTSDASDASSFFERGYVSATSSSRTSFETEFCPPAPTRATFTSMAPSNRSKSPRRKRGEIPQLLLASTSNEPSTYPRDGQAVPLTPHTAPCNPPKTPAAPVAFIGSGTTYHRSRKSSKVAPMPDTKAPIVQAFPARTPKTRRASLTGVVDSRAINPSPLAASRPSYDTDDDAVFSEPSEPSRFIASLKRRRARPAVPSSQEQYSSCQDSLGDGFSVTAPHSYPNVNHNEVRPAIFGSGPRQRAEDQWVGSWNRPDIYTVQSDLRALRQR